MLQDFTIIELSTMVVSVFGALALCCGAISKSRCERIKCGCIEIQRKVPDLSNENKEQDKITGEGF